MKDITLENDLTVLNCVHVRQVMFDALSQSSKICFDMGQVKDCDTSGVQLLLSLKKSAHGMQSDVSISNVPAVVVEAVGK